ncbi:MAG: hypothetical protein Q4D55_06675 [Eubacteriales bacterium]|nr:hypothetical protein [Eubacteriales bacterium]
MRRFFYGISVILLFGLLCAVYCGACLWGTRGGALRGAPKVVKAQEGEEEGFWIREEGGRIAVYEGDRATLFEKTWIPFAALPQELQGELRQGRYVRTLGEVYGFLENYSS